MGSTLILIIQILTFFVVFAASIAVENAIEHVSDVRRRLRESSARRLQSDSPILKDQIIRNPFIRWVRSVTSLSDNKEWQKLARELSFAGFDHPAAPAWFLIIRFGLAIGLPFGFLLGMQFFGQTMGEFGLIVLSLMLCGIGLIAPSSIVDRRADARRGQLEREFPDALDLLVVCVEAGLGLEAAFVRVGQEMRVGYPRISYEFARVSDEFRAGRSRAEALRALSDRTAVATIKSFVTLIIQTEALGVSIGETLRTYSNEMRETRYIKAEEKALRIPVLMTVPLVACILPVIIASLMLPVTIDVIRVLLPALAGTAGGAP